jgi:hypothetical protein
MSASHQIIGKWPSRLEAAQTMYFGQGKWAQAVPGGARMALRMSKYVNEYANE